MQGYPDCSYGEVRQSRIEQRVIEYFFYDKASAEYWMRREIDESDGSCGGHTVAIYPAKT